MTPLPPNRRLRAQAFTFIELVIVIAVIGIMSALAVGAFSNASNDAREIVARQQQAALQSAVDAWAIAQMTSSNTVSQVQTTYNAATTSSARLDLVANYLDDATYEHFVEHIGLASTNEVMSDATRKLNWHINLPTWADDSYPKVDLVKSAAPATP